MTTRQMRLPTCAEWNTMANIAHEENSIIHWENIFSWCQDAVPTWASYRAVRGWVSARFWLDSYATYRSVDIGFRPALEALGSDTLESDGFIVTVGTLYMDGQPVRVPQNPVWNGDITDYAPGTKLELREALADPAYQVHAIKAGDVLIADRVLVRNISWNDIQEALEDKPENG